MKPADALAAATIVPAQTFGVGGETGSIAVGKRAELVLVDGDPSQRIGDLRNVEIVMQGERLMTAGDLRAAVMASTVRQSGRRNETASLGGPPARR